MKWFNTLSHNRWLEQETDRIFDFGKNSVVPTGFGWLGNKGQIKEEMGTHLWITARMLHVYSVAAAMGRPGAYSLVDHGIKAMNGALRDKKYGGWTIITELVFSLKLLALRPTVSYSLPFSYKLGKYN